MKLLDFPNRITIELTNRCNVSCTFCNRQKIKMQQGDMKPEVFYKIVDEASKHLPVKLVVFFRGESLMNPNLIEFIKYAKQKGLGPIQLASNALLLDEKMADDLINSEIDFISFSLDTLDADIYKKSRLMGDLNISRQNVEIMGKKCKVRKRKGNSAPTLQVSTIDLDIYKKDQKKFIEHWKEYVDIVRVYYEHDEKGQLVNLEIRNLLDINHGRMPCRKIFTDMVIYWDGRLAICNYDWEEHRNIGDITRMTLEDAWHSAEYERIRKMHIENQFDDSICAECHHWKIDYTEKGYLGKIY